MSGYSSNLAVNRPVAVDLYAGVGGLSLGLEQAGFDLGAALELEPVHAIAHKFNFPSTPVLCADALVTSGQELLDAAGGGVIDAVVGGPPCQGFSAGGVRHEEDDRNQQLLRFVDLVVEIRPKVFCLENVLGLLETRFDSLRERAFSTLESAGYALSGTDSYVNAKDFGVPQNRKRVIILGGLDGAPKLLPPASPDTVTVAQALAGLPEVSRYWHLLHSDSVDLKSQDIADRAMVRSAYARRLAGLDVDPSDLAYERNWDSSVITSSARTLHTSKTVQRFRNTAPGDTEPRSRLQRLDPEGVARTLRAGTGTDRGSHTSPRPIHPKTNRVITVREAARLHGYPDWFRFNATNWHGHRQVGNSVPPPLARAIGKALTDALDRSVVKPSVTLDLGDPDWLRLTPKAALANLRTP